MKLQFFIFLFFAPLLFSCTLYQNEGREALEKDKNGIITGPAIFSQGLELTCYQTPLAPSELTGPVHVLETSFEGQGYASYLVRAQSVSHVLVYELTKQEHLQEQHRYCRMKLLKGETASYITEAVDLGVFHLLDI